LTGSAQPLLSALQAADRRIAKAAQPRLNPVQRAMARDMDRIKASPVADLPLLAARLDELARAVDDWPLVNAEPRKRTAVSNAKGGKDAAQAVAPVVQPQKPGGSSAAAPAPKADAEQDSAVASTQTAESDSNTAAATEASPAKDAVPESKSATAPAAIKASASDKTQKAAAVTPAEPDNLGMVRTAQAVWNRWWGRLIDHVSASTRDLVRVSRIDEPDAVLLSPEQAVFLRENLKLRLLNARLSLLSRQVAASRADMQAVKTAMVKYFDPQSPVNKKAQLALTDVLQASTSLELPRPDDTLAALAKAAGGR
jgi:uroporphyrin-3 C-methyltransferase